MAVAIALGALIALALPGAVGAAAPRYTKVAGVQLVEVRAGGRVQAAPAVDDSAPAVGARGSGSNIAVTYVGFGGNTAAKNAFQRAVNTVKAKLNSPITIKVQANWTALGPGVLGSAGPNGVYLYHPEKRSYGVTALEERLGQNINGTSFDVIANFSSAFPNWYFGTGATPANDYDFQTVVLHELLHGMGSFGSFWVNGSQGMWGFTDGTNTYKMRYDQFQYNQATGGLKLAKGANFANPSAALKAQLIDGTVYFAGPQVMAALGAARARLYAPNPWQGGSSNSHFDEATYAAGSASALMTPQLGQGEQIRTMGNLTKAMFRDLGYTTN